MLEGDYCIHCDEYIRELEAQNAQYVEACKQFEATVEGLEALLTNAISWIQLDCPWESGAIMTSLQEELERHEKD